MKMVYLYIAEYYFYCNEPTRYSIMYIIEWFIRNSAAVFSGTVSSYCGYQCLSIKQVYHILRKGVCMSRFAIPITMAGVLIMLFFVLGCSGESGQKNGPYTAFYQNGKLKTAGAFKAGKKEGVWKEYAEDGTLTNEYNYQNGLREGISKRYYTSGALFAEFRYVNDKREGISKRYFTNAALQAEDNYRNDVREGISKSYNENGKLLKEESYKNGKKDGSCIIYNDDGKKRYIDIFKDGRKISREKFDRQGNPESKKSLQDAE